MSQLKNITFFTIAGGQQTLRLQHYQSGNGLEYWKDNDIAISGKVKHNLRGARGTWRIEYEHCIQGAVYRSILNNIMSDLSTKDSIVISEGSDLAGGRVVVPTENFNKLLQYGQSILQFNPTMEFRDVTLNHFGNPYVESGYVETGYVE